MSIFNASGTKNKNILPTKDSSKVNSNDNIVIDTGEFTYSKLIIRDQTGIGKTPMIKELKYVPVCEMSMNKRKVSQKNNEEWARLG